MFIKILLYYTSKVKLGSMATKKSRGEHYMANFHNTKFNIVASPWRWLDSDLVRSHLTQTHPRLKKSNLHPSRPLTPSHRTRQMAGTRRTAPSPIPQPHLPQSGHGIMHACVWGMRWGVCVCGGGGMG